MRTSLKSTRLVLKVPATYRTASPRYWCNHCADSHDTRTAMGQHYEWHVEHMDECATWDMWIKQTYEQSRHAENESEWEGEEDSRGDLHDEGSDEEDKRDEGESGMRVGYIPGEADEESDEELRDTLRSRKPVPAIEQARFYFNLAAHGDPENDILELKRRAVAKLRETDAEVEGGESMSLDGGGSEDEEKDNNNIGGACRRRRRRGARGVRRMTKSEKKDEEKVHPVAKASWNMVPYKGESEASEAGICMRPNLDVEEEDSSLDGLLVS